KAFSVLQYLVDHAGRLVTQNELLEALWSGTFVQPEVLKSHILDVRTALGDDAKHPSFIETVPRRGYRFIAAVRDPDDSVGQNPQNDRSNQPSRREDDFRQPAEPLAVGDRNAATFWNSRPLWWVTGVFLAIGLLLGWAAAFLRGPSLEAR